MYIQNIHKKWKKDEKANKLILTISMQMILLGLYITVQIQKTHQPIIKWKI